MTATNITSKRHVSTRTLFILISLLMIALACTTPLTETYMESVYRVIAWSLKQHAPVASLWQASQFPAELPVYPALIALLSHLIDGTAQQSVPVSLTAVRLPNAIAACFAVWFCLRHLQNHAKIFFALSLVPLVCLHTAPYGFLALSLIGLLHAIERSSMGLSIVATAGVLLFGNLAWLFALLLLAAGLFFAKRRAGVAIFFAIAIYFTVLICIAFYSPLVRDHLLIYNWYGFGQMWHATYRPQAAWWMLLAIISLPGLLRHDPIALVRMPLFWLMACFLFFARDARHLAPELALPFSLLACWKAKPHFGMGFVGRTVVGITVFGIACALLTEPLQLRVFGPDAMFANEMLFSNEMLLANVRFAELQRMIWIAFAISTSLFFWGYRRMKTPLMPLCLLAIWLLPFFQKQYEQKQQVLEFLRAENIDNAAVMGDFDPWWQLQNSQLISAPLVSNLNDWPLDGTQWFITDNTRNGPTQCQALNATKKFANDFYLICKIQ